jgi:hypothetical protein
VSVSAPRGRPAPSIGTTARGDRHIEALFGRSARPTIAGKSDPVPSGPPGRELIEMYGFFGIAHARGALVLRAVRERLAAEGGQGTVEYVGLVLLVAALMGGMVAAVGGLGSLSGIGKELGEAITKKIVQGVQKITFAG